MRLVGRKQAWLADQLNVGTNVVTNWKRRGGAPKARAREIATALGCTADELLAASEIWHPPEEGTSDNSTPTYNGPKHGDNFEPGPDLKLRRYPEITWVQAGMWTELCENFQPDEHTTWHQCHIDLGPCGFVVTVRGPSMTAPAGIYPSFPDGIKLFVNPHLDALPGSYVIVVRDGRATFKKLTQVEGELYMEALNPDWPERYQRILSGDQFCGVVKHAGFDL